MDFEDLVENGGKAVDLAGVAVIVVAVMAASVIYLLSLARRGDAMRAHEGVKDQPDGHRECEFAKRAHRDQRQHCEAQRQDQPGRRDRRLSTRYRQGR